jgi:hypothetical protein
MLISGWEVLISMAKLRAKEMNSQVFFHFIGALSTATLGTSTKGGQVPPISNTALNWMV